MSKKTIRRITGAVLIIASLVVCQIPVEDVNAEDTKSVTSEFELNGTTLVKYTGTANVVSVPDTVKIIGEEAFADNTSLKTINLPSSIEKISYAAFSGCINLTKVTIPDNCEEIGIAAFCNCSKLETVKFGVSTKALGTGVFTGCHKLSSVTGNDYFVCVDGAIYDDEMETLYELLQNAKVKKSVSSNDYVNLTTYKMPDSVKKIKPYALYGCRNIDTLELSPFLNEIPAHAFSYCNGLKTVKIPYSVNLIDMKAFENCVNLEDVEIPASVTFIHETAFDGCSKLNIIAPEASYACKWFLNFDNTPVNIIDNEDNDWVDASSNNLIDINSQTKKEIEGLIGETIIVGRQAFFFIDNTALTVNGHDATEDYTDIVKQMETVLQTETNGKGLSLPKFAVIEDKIAGKAFYGDNTLTEYEISKGITSIGDFAFARTNLSTITIPDSVTHIGYGAFYHCDNLTTALVPSTVTDIEPSAFANTRMLENWYLYGASDYLIMGDGILVAYKGSDTNVSIPEGVKQIGPECFKNKGHIMEVSFPESLTRVCEEAFYGCSNLRTVTGGMNLVTIEDRAFYGCPLNTIRLVDTVKEIGLDAFNLSVSSLSDAYKTVVFQGTELPKVTYNKTTSRLTNSSYREDALEGVKVAIVSSEEIDRVDTVLDRNYSGFSGLICVISEPNTEYFNGTLRIIDCTLTADEASKFSIPNTMYIYGKGYNFLPDELSSVLYMASIGAYYEAVKEPLETVSFAGNTDKYVLFITKDEAVNPEIKEAYKRIYADTVPGNISTYEISVKEEDSEVYLSKFGKQTLEILIKLPDNMPTTNLHVICTDEDAQLEDLGFSVITVDNELFVQFEISHTGHYGLYSFNSTAVSQYNLDTSPDTGDRIHPKWFLALGLFSLGLALIFIKAQENQLPLGSGCS